MLVINLSTKKWTNYYIFANITDWRCTVNAKQMRGRNGENENEIPYWIEMVNCISFDIHR